MKVYLDTCVVVYVVERHPLFATTIEARLRAATSATFCYSPLVQLECLVMPFRTNDRPLVVLYEAFFNAQTLLDLPPEVFYSAARLRAFHKSLKTPDAIHLAAAQWHGCTEFWTNDDRLSTIAPGLAIKVT